MAWFATTSSSNPETVDLERLSEPASAPDRVSMDAPRRTLADVYYLQKKAYGPYNYARWRDLRQGRQARYQELNMRESKVDLDSLSTPAFSDRYREVAPTAAFPDRSQQLLQVQRPIMYQLATTLTLQYGGLAPVMQLVQHIPDSARLLQQAKWVFWAQDGHGWVLAVFLVVEQPKELQLVARFALMDPRIPLPRDVFPGLLNKMKQWSAEAYTKPARPLTVLVSVDNEEALQLYKDMGFEKVGSMFRDPGTGARVYKMRWQQKRSLFGLTKTSTVSNSSSRTGAAAARGASAGLTCAKCFSSLGALCLFPC